MLIYFAFILTVLIGFCGLAIDTARIEVRTNQLQAAADAGALAGAGEVWAGRTYDYVQAANSDIATMLSVNHLPADTTNNVNLGPDYGPYQGDYSTVEVTVNESFPTLFMGILSRANATMPLKVRAVAQLPPCMLFFGNPTVSNGFQGVGNNNWDYQIASAGMDTATAWGCPMYSKNGYNIDGFARYGGSQIRTSAPKSATNVSGSTSSPALYNVPPMTDPLAYVVEPSPGSCKNSTPISAINQPAGSTYTLTPGTYCGKTATYTGSPAGCNPQVQLTTPAIDIRGKNNVPDFLGVGCPTQGGTNGNNCASTSNVVFTPGLYIIIGGINLSCVTATGSGVTLYFTNSSTVLGYGIVQIVSSTWNVNAATDNSLGATPGVIMMTDRAWNGGNQDLQIRYSTWYADGVIYSMRTGLFGFALPMSAPNYMNVVAANMYSYDVEVRPSNNYSTLPYGSPLRLPVTLVN
jgi:Flp pilus assembly protein TadG